MDRPTWRTLATLRHERDWSRRRLLHELQNGLPYRTIPPGHTINWHDRNIERWLDVEASEVRFHDAEWRGSLSSGKVTIGIEVLPPTDAPASPSPSPPPPQTTPALKAVSDKDLRDCIRAIAADYPDNPLNRDTLWIEVQKPSRLGQWVARDRVWAARKKVASQWAGRRGRPSKSAQ